MGIINMRTTAPGIRLKAMPIKGMKTKPIVKGTAAVVKATTKAISIARSIAAAARGTTGQGTTEQGMYMQKAMYAKGMEKKNITMKVAAAVAKATTIKGTMQSMLNHLAAMGLVLPLLWLRQISKKFQPCLAVRQRFNGRLKLGCYSLIRLIYKMMHGLLLRQTAPPPLLLCFIARLAVKPLLCL